MLFIIVFFISLWLGYKLRGAVDLYRQVKQVNFVEKTVEMILNRDEKISLYLKKDKVNVGGDIND